MSPFFWKADSILGFWRLSRRKEILTETDHLLFHQKWYARSQPVDCSGYLSVEAHSLNKAVNALATNALIQGLTQKKSDQLVAAD